MSKEVKKSIALQGSILALAGILSKIIGFVYRIPMANIMGNTGNGLYSVSFGVYNIALTLSSYSMPLAVSKLMSERIAKKEYKNSHRLFIRALIFSVLTGLLAFSFLFFGATFIAGVYKRPGLEYPLRVLAPTTFVVALLGTCRGFFQGHRNMVPTALSQVLEQIVNAVVSVVATSFFVHSVAKEGMEAALGAMGGTFGTLAGAFTALLFFLILFVLKRKEIREERNHEDLGTEENALIYKAIILTVIPVIISQSIYTLGYTLDDLLFGNIMAMKGVDDSTSTAVQGVFNTQYNQMINLPVAIATAMASATLPGVVASYTVGDFNGVKKKISDVLRLNMIIAIPSSVGLAVLACPIMQVLFPRLQELHTTAATLLMAGSTAVFFYALSTLTTSILQGCDKMRIPVVHAGISLLIHVVIVGTLLYFTDLGVYALVIGNVSFPMIVSILNVRSIYKLLSYRFDVKGTFIKPFISALIMGAGAFLSMFGCTSLLGGKYHLLEKSDLSMGKECVCLIISVLVAVILYFGILIATKGIRKDELKRIPVLKKIVR